MQVEWYGQSAFRLTDGATTVFTLFAFTLGGRRVAHLGDLGQSDLREEQARPRREPPLSVAPAVRRRTHAARPRLRTARRGHRRCIPQPIGSVTC
jgi:L-ascorbate metabolism protein UlaG (beta-lactamase superfamily)